MTQTLMVKVSPALKAEVEKAAEAGGMNMSEFVRACVAERIGYDLNADDALDSRGRPRTYQTEAQRKAARRQHEAERQRNQNAVLETLMRQERLNSIEALERWLIARGVSLDDDEQVAQSA